MNWSTVRKQVIERDDGGCVRCGREAQHVHHRKLKGIGGTGDDKLKYGFANLISLCFECHSEIHAHPADSYNAGYLVHSWDDPATVFIVAKLGVLTLRDDGSSDLQGSEPLF